MNTTKRTSLLRSLLTLALSLSLLDRNDSFVSAPSRTQRAAFLNHPSRQPWISKTTTTTTTTSESLLVLGLKINTNIRYENSDDEDDDEDDGLVGTGPNWIERAFPVDTTGKEGTGSKEELKKVEDYNLGISGVSFQTGGLSKRMFDVIISKSQFAANPDDEIRKALTLYAMDFTAKEATKAALKQNGLEIALMEEEEDEGMWGDVDSIRLLDETTQQPLPELYDSTEEAIEQGGWTPGQGFDFVVRQVPAKIRELTLEELMQALDPEGSLREEAKEAGMTLPDEDIRSLRDLANDNVRRSETAPRGATDEKNAFAGVDKKRGYTPIPQSNLLSINEDGTEDHKTLMHVMDAMVSHGALIVDVTDGGSNFETAKQLASMWEGAERFFDTVNQDATTAQQLPPMTTVMETGSQTAKVGYASCDNDSLQFLETRRDRTTGQLLPEEATSILGDSGADALRSVFDAVSEIGTSIVRIAVAASSLEAGAFAEDEGAQASKAASSMAQELLDNGSESGAGSSGFHVCMSPHRLCRYTNNQPLKPKNNDDDDDDNEDADSAPPSPSREVFGAHTDSTWVTIVPVAAVSGLEVYDEAAEQWYRPELAARRHWENEQKQNGKDPTALVETISEDDGSALPWNSRYVVMMPGELLQLATRNEIPAAVHRVVATKDCPSRLSAPILLRCRPGVKMDVAKYLGGSEGDPLLEECDGMTIEEIHDALQPTSFQ